MIQLPSVPQYILESSLSLITFYAIFYWLLRKDTFHHFNKYYLLTTSLISVLLPFIDFHVIDTANQAAGSVESLIQYRADLKQYESGMSNNMFYTITISDVVKAVFYVGVFLTGLKFLHSLFQLIDKVKKNKRRSVSEDTPKNILGSSVFSFLYWNEEANSKNNQLLMKANASKLKPWHSIDVIIMELLVVVNWINPLIYLFRNRFYKINEYVIDESIAAHSGGRKQYAEQLMETNLKFNTNQDRSNYVSIVDRVMVLTKKRTSALGKLKPLLVIPMAFVMMSLYSFDYADKLPDEVKSSLIRIENSLMNASEHVVVNLTHSKRNYEWEFKWGEHLYGLTSRDEDGNLSYNMSKEVSLFDLYESIESKPSYKTKGIYESMGFDIKITSNSDTVSSISVPIGDYESLGDKMKKEIVKHKTPFNIYFSNIGSTNGKRDGGFMITVYQFMKSSEKNKDTNRDREVKARWGDLNLSGSDFGWVISNNYRQMYGTWNQLRYSEKPFNIQKKDFLEKISSKFELIVNDEEISTKESTRLTLSIVRPEVTKSNADWNPSADKLETENGSRTVKTITKVYHGRSVSMVNDEYDFRALLSSGDVYLKDILSSVSDGDVITIAAIDTLDTSEEGNHFFFNMTIIDKDAAYTSPYEVELPPTSDSYTNFQIYYNAEDDQTYVKVDTTETANEKIVRAYRHSESYKLTHVPNFKTKNRVNDTRTLPGGTLSIDPKMNLSTTVLRMERLNEHYTLSDRMIRMDWGKMISLPGIGNFSRKEFKRSNRSNILLSAGDHFLDVSRFDLVIIREGDDPIRIRTDNVKSDICRQALKGVEGAVSIYFDNIIVNDNDEYKYYPYQFVFNIE